MEQRTSRSPDAAGDSTPVHRWLQGLLDSSGEPVAALDLEFRFLALSSAFEDDFARRTGTRPAVGMSLHDALSHQPDLRARALEYWTRALQGEEFSLTVEHDGAACFEYRFAPLRDSAGRRVGAACWGRDVTERGRAAAELRQAEAARDQSELVLKRLRDSGLIGVLSWTWNAEIADANDVFLTMLGYSRDEFRAGRVRWREITPPEHLEQDARVLQTLRETGVSPPYEKEFLHKDGTRVSVLIVGLALDDRGGIAFVIDITERKRAVMALRESEARFRQLADAMPQIVWAARPDGHLDYFNARWYALTGAPEGVDGDDNWLPIVHPDDRDRVRSQWYEAVRTGQPLELECRFQIPGSDECRWYLGRALPVRDAGGRIVRWYGTCTDIHDQKRSEGDVRQREELFRGIFENAAVGMAQIDRQGNCLRVNQTLCDIVGYTREELLRMRFHDLSHAEDVDAGLDLFGPLLRDEIASYSMEKRYLHRQGHVIWVNLTMAAQGDPGGPSRFAVAVIEDITSRKQAEQELRELNETLEQRIAQRTGQLRLLATELTQAEQRERRRLAYALHEDIQQLMVAVKMKVGQLGLHLAEPFLTDVRQAEHLLQQLIQASRSLAVQLSPPILYDAGLAAALEWLGRKIEDEFGLRVDVKVDAAVEPADQNISLFLLQAVRELLLNIVKYAGTSEARVSLSRGEGEQVQISVEDHGVGMDLQALQTREATADRFGLFSIEHRLDLLGGHFALASSPGQGTTATLTAPLHPPQSRTDVAVPAASTAGPPAPQGNGSHIRVLLVDDHRILRQGLARLLAAEPDMDVVGEAADGVQAIELARHLSPDVICMDVTMPRRNGVEATRVILQERPEVRVIGLSMHESAEMDSAMRAAGAVAYLSKDGPSDELIAAIRAAAAKQSAASRS